MVPVSGDPFPLVRYWSHQSRLDLDEANVESVGEAVVSVVDVALYEAVEEAPRAKATAPA